MLYSWTMVSRQYVFFSTAVACQGIEGASVSLYQPGPWLSFRLFDGNLPTLVLGATTNKNPYATSAAYRAAL